MNRVTLVCGAGGFIGGTCLPVFDDAGWKVAASGRGMLGESRRDRPGIPFYRGDFSDATFASRMLSEVKPDRVVFLAAPASVGQSFIDPVADFRDQTSPFIQFLECARLTPNPPGVLLVSSAAIYGNPRSIPVPERAAPDPISPYGFHKLQQELLLDEYAKLYGMSTCKARVFSTYGPGLRHLAVWDIARRAIGRDYLHVSDVARALESICRHAPFQGESINVASGVEQTIEHVADLIYEAVGAKATPMFEGSQVKGNPVRWRADVQRLAALGFSPRVPFASGIADTVAWISANA